MTSTDPGLCIKNLYQLADSIAADGVPVVGAPALGTPLHTNGKLGADLLYVRAGDRFPVHTHPGDHLLLCVAGAGTISVGERTYKVRPGDIYMVDGLIPHAVGAAEDEDHILVAIGSPHKAGQAPDRMQFVDWDGNKLDAPIFAE
jgi:quercetin dioxygenase-like cupin family protein